MSTFFENKTIKDLQISKGLFLKIVQNDMADRILVEFKSEDGKMVLQRSFQNTVEGRRESAGFEKKIKSLKDLKSYFGLNVRRKMSLVKILEQIKVNEGYANTQVEAEPRSTYTGRAGRQVRAIESLKELKAQYRKELSRSAMFVVVVGSARDQFSNIGTENFGLFATDPNELYVSLANRVNPSLYSGRATAHDVFEVLGRVLEDKALELGVVEYPQMIFKQEYRIDTSSKEGVIELIRTAINQQVGAELVGLQSLYSITDKAIAKNHASKTTPVVLAVDSEELATDLIKALPRLTKNVFLVVAGKSTKTLRSIPGALLVKEVTNESVEETLTTIKNTIKK